MTRTTHLAALVATAALATAAMLGVAGLAWAAWAPAEKIDTIAGNSSELNTPSQDGCPIQSPDGLSLYLASNRPGGKGGLDIWVASRASSGAPWRDPRVQAPPCPLPRQARDLCDADRTAGKCRAPSHAAPPTPSGSRRSAAPPFRRPYTAVRSARAPRCAGQRHRPRQPLG